MYWSRDFDGLEGKKRALVLSKKYADAKTSGGCSESGLFGGRSSRSLADEDKTVLLLDGASGAALSTRPSGCGALVPAQQPTEALGPGTSGLLPVGE